DGRDGGPDALAQTLAAVFRALRPTVIRDFRHMTADASDPNDKPATQGEAGQTMWGGRFSAKPAELMQAINVSIGFDKRLAAQDLAGSRAHAAMLQSTGVIT